MVYDIETYPNIFTCAFEDRVFEISWRKNQVREFIEYFTKQDELVGFNNFFFDYPVVHWIIENQDAATPELIFQFAQSLIGVSDDQRFRNVVWPNRQYVKQVDLYLIHHFDNKAKRTSLKSLQFAMRSDSIQDLPFEVGKILTWEECDALIEYNRHDVQETRKFLDISKEAIEFRREVSAETEIDMINFNDTKIGKKYFEAELEKANPGCTSGKTDRSYKGEIPDPLDPEYNRKVPVELWLPELPAPEFGKQHTISAHKRNAAARVKKHEQNMRAVWVPVRDILFPYITFDSPEFALVLEEFRTLNIVNTKGGFHKECTKDGFTFVFGAGGIHGSVSAGSYYSDDEFEILDIDVASYYPNIAIKNKVYPEHIGVEFCRIYDDVFKRRQKYPKGSAINKMLKLALNGVFGDSNNQHSVFFDPKYTMAITINGQLMLCMLAEQLMRIPELTLLQINTDGLTVRYRRTRRIWIDKYLEWWQSLTKLTLESVSYSAMHIRDVNNYIAVGEDGKAKRKGAYEYEQEWHKDHSSLVIQKAAEAHLVHDIDVEEFIYNHDDIMDFMMRAKVNRTDRLVTVTPDGEVEQQKISRFYVSNDGHELVKYMPPLKTKPYQIRRNAYQGTKGWMVTICNDIKDFKGGINYDYYVTEARKLIDPLRGGK